MNDRWKIRNKRQPNGRTKKTSSALRYERRREKAILANCRKYGMSKTQWRRLRYMSERSDIARSHEANHSESKKDGSIG